jgi:F-type H+-transporting ATPase subunit delta
MAERATVARPYAKAAFEYAQQHKSFSGWSSMFARASAVVSDPQLAKVLNSPRVNTTDLLGLIADACGTDLDEHGRNFLTELADNRRLGVLPQIAELFEEMRADIENVADVEITSAIALDDAQRTRLGKALEKKLKRTIRLHCAVDAALIGGAVIRSGDFVIDGSVKARLERLTNELTH